MPNVVSIRPGDVRNQLTVIKHIRTDPKAGRIYQCRCTCGNLCEGNTRALNRGNKRSCGCLQRIKVAQRNKDNATHAMSKHPLYDVHRSMLRRCYEVAAKDYPNYGGRGIKVCRSWHHDKETFFKWALANGWRAGLQIDRKNNDRGYAPWNCRFVTCKVNNNNRRGNIVVTIKGVRMSFKSAWEKYGRVDWKTAAWRYKAGWPLKQSLQQPSRGVR